MKETETRVGFLSARRKRVFFAVVVNCNSIDESACNFSFKLNRAVTAIAELNFTNAVGEKSPANVDCNCWLRRCLYSERGNLCPLPFLSLHVGGQSLFFLFRLVSISIFLFLILVVAFLVFPSIFFLLSSHNGFCNSVGTATSYGLYDRRVLRSLAGAGDFSVLQHVQFLGPTGSPFCWPYFGFSAVKRHRASRCLLTSI